MSWVFYFVAAIIVAWSIFWLVRYIVNARKGKCCDGDCTRCRGCGDARNTK